MKTINDQRVMRRKKIRAKIKSTQIMPRLSVFRSNKHIYAQIIDDTTHKTVVAASDVKIKKESSKLGSAKTVGANVAKSAVAKNIKKVVFDRGGYKYHGRIKALAEAARVGGLKF